MPVALPAWAQAALDAATLGVPCAVEDVGDRGHEQGSDGRCCTRPARGRYVSMAPHPGHSTRTVPPSSRVTRMRLAPGRAKITGPLMA